MVWPSGQFICPFLIMCMVSIPAIVILALQNDLNPSIGRVNGGRVGTALVNGDLLRQVVQVDGTFQKATRCGQISLGSEQKVHGVTESIDSAVQLFPLARDFDVRLVKSPTAVH